VAAGKPAHRLAEIAGLREMIIIIAGGTALVNTRRRLRWARGSRAFTAGRAAFDRSATSPKWAGARGVMGLWTHHGPALGLLPCWHELVRPAATMARARNAGLWLRGNCGGRVRRRLASRHRARGVAVVGRFSFRVSIQMHFVRYSVVAKGRRKSRLGLNLPQHSLAKYLLEASNNAYLKHM
jgi:hypothetical protein